MPNFRHTPKDNHKGHKDHKGNLITFKIFGCLVVHNG
jgi:hypothetical protein